MAIAGDLDEAALGQALDDPEILAAIADTAVRRLGAGKIMALLAEAPEAVRDKVLAVKAGHSPEAAGASPPIRDSSAGKNPGRHGIHGRRPSCAEGVGSAIEGRS